MNEGTIRHEGAPAPIRALRVVVAAGPDVGKEATAGEVLTVGTGEENDLVLADPTVSRHHLELSRSAAGVVVVDLGSTNGTLIGPARVDRASVPVGTTLRLGRTTLRIEEGGEHRPELHGADRLGSLLGHSPPMRALMARVERAARGDGALLVLGETGTGKEVVARTLHDLGPRSSMPFEVVDCGAVLPTLLASELFGHEQGAFTGAERRHLGAFERAAGGTLFLDEIGELPPTVQAALLGVLERRSFRRLGGEEVLPLEARIVAATHRDLRAGVNDGSFRADLYYRLAVVTLKVPPLRDHLEDLPLLVAHFAAAAGGDPNAAQAFAAPMLAELARHRWPGNIRELRNLVEATVLMGEPPALETGREEVPPAASGTVIDVAPWLSRPYTEAKDLVAEQFELQYFRALLEACGGSVAKAAEAAGIHRTYLTRLLKRRGIKLQRSLLY